MDTACKMLFFTKIFCGYIFTYVRLKIICKQTIKVSNLIVLWRNSLLFRQLRLFKTPKS